MLQKKVSQYWKKLEKENLDMCANPTLFRLLKINGAKFKDKKVLKKEFNSCRKVLME